VSNPLKKLLFLCGIAGLVVTLLGTRGPVQAQAGQDDEPGDQSPPTAREAAPYDPTGNWVSVITNNWRTRMVPPPIGDYQDMPLNDAGRQAADAWDPARDEAAGLECRHYGAASIMFQPARLQVSWQDDQTLRMDIDAGTQTRIFRFGDAAAAAGERTWQGDSGAEWEARRPSRGADDSPGRYLKVTTTNIRPGYLRKNGVPYGERAVLTEYYDVFQEPDGTTMMIVTIAVDDSEFLEEQYIVIAHFKKEPDGSRWSPSPCSARW
jgi:hypothetical protein